MPEGPVIILMKENLQKFEGKKILKSVGSSVPENIDLTGKILNEIKTFGKLTFLVFDDFVIRIHLLMFGAYYLKIHSDIENSLRLGLEFENGSIFFYTCSVKFEKNEILEKIDWKADIMSEKWSTKNAEDKLLNIPETMICDALMNQEIFSGLGNIIKNESLFRVKIHPESLIKNIPATKISELMIEIKKYSKEFLKYKRTESVSKTFTVYQQKKCPLCGDKLIKKDTGKTRRTSFYCLKDQKLYQ